MIEEKLLKLRKKQGYSQQEVADFLSVTRQTISNWECGQGMPSLDKAAELAKLYHISLDDLTGNEVEVVTKEAKPKDLHLLRQLIGKTCRIDCDDLSLTLDIGGNDKVKILDVNEDWLRVQYLRRKEGNLLKKETVVKLIDLSAVNGFEFMEEDI
ncbi:XRE family transcriptional regulator [Hungatella hathewayi]|nr:XRE family transcriptional regulator [Hungatella hathewayi]